MKLNTYQALLARNAQFITDIHAAIRIYAGMLHRHGDEHDKTIYAALSKLQRDLRRAQAVQKDLKKSYKDTAAMYQAQRQYVVGVITDLKKQFGVGL